MLWHLEAFPTYMGCTRQDVSQDLNAGMPWGVCKNCGVIQLLRLPSVFSVYLHNHGEGIGRTWREHEDTFSAFVRKFSAPPVISLDRFNLPAEILAYPAFDFPSTCTFTFVHSHVLEHWREPRDVLMSIAKCMSPGSRMIFSIPHMDSLLRAGVLATLNFEHTYYLSDWATRFLLQSCGFEIIGTQSFAQHSLFVACERRDGSPASVIPERDRESRMLFESAVTRYQNDIKQIARKVCTFDGFAYLFGAHIFSQYLLRLGLDEDMFDGVLDNSHEKNGKRLYGTSLEVFHPRILQSLERSTVVLRTGVYDTEIREGIVGNGGTHVVFC
jgi:SAM-dependent methyltransferase